jgi:hypothetical protein
MRGEVLDDVSNAMKAEHRGRTDIRLDGSTLLRQMPLSHLIRHPTCIGLAEADAHAQAIA